MTSVRLDSISKVYDSSVSAVNDVSCTIQPGEFLVLVGPSGCGKSSLLRMIAGLEDISSGQLFFDDERMNNVPARNRDVGMVFQNYALYPHMSVFENIAFPLVVRKEPKDLISKRVNEVAAMLNIGGLIDRLPKQLSGGQRQRVALGRAIARKPRVFLFDEPLSNLDAALRISMRAELIALQRRVGSTAIYVTHDHVEAMTMADRIIVLNHGRVMQIGTPHEVYSQPSNRFVASFLGSPAMNFFQGKIDRTQDLCFVEDGSGLRIRLSGHATVLPKNLDAVRTLGVRPEDIRIVSEDGDFSVQCERCEFVGHETIFQFRSAETLKNVRIDSNTSFEHGAHVKCAMRSDRLYFFDVDENRL